MYRLTLLLLLLFVPSAFAYDNGRIPVNTPESAKRMVENLISVFGEKYPKGPEYLKQLDAAAQKMRKEPKNADARKQFEDILREAALANPLLDFDKILITRRNTQKGWGFVALNAYTNDVINRKGWDNELAVIENLRTTPKLTSLYKHPDTAIMRDVDLNFDGKRILFSSINEQGRWAVFQINIDGSGLKELTPPAQEDVDWFDACYLPEEGYIISASTAGMQGLPCENGNRVMVNLYRVNTAAEPKRARQLTFEQDSDWHPTVMNDGRVLYLRWEYADIPHYMSRILFTMQPDGRQQRAIWGSGSYFPTAYKNPRVIPGQSSMVVGVASGHHTQGTRHGEGIAEAGRLILINPEIATKYPFRFDPVSKEWGAPLTHLNVFPRTFPKEKTGVIQEIPGWGEEVVGNVYDNQGGAGKYRFAHPYPLNENYFLVSMRTDNQGMFGLYLVDRFDNMTKIMDSPTDSFFQAIPMKEQTRPPVRMDNTDPSQTTGTMFITDVYEGGGLKGVPRGVAKSLRIFAYHFGYRKSGGHESVGMVSSWDIKRILGTVPIEEDGSASFNVPSNTPLSIQVLDKDGRAIQVMRSWTLCMPGEQQSCIGCHETPLEVTPNKRVIAGGKPPRDITPWRGPARPFGYEAEIQPMLESKCISCHNDQTKEKRNMLSFEAHKTGDWRTDTSYAALNPFFWRTGPEPDLDMLPPMDYHASVSELIQRFQKDQFTGKGHYGLQLAPEDWDRFNTWIDLNVPYRGQWTNPEQEKRRYELAMLYAGLDTNPEEEYRQSLVAAKTETVSNPKLTPEQLDEVIKKYTAADNLKAENFPFDAATAQKMQSGDKVRTALIIELGKEAEPSAELGFPGNPDLAWMPSTQQLVSPPIVASKIDLGENRRLTFVKIPAGSFVMGQLDGMSDEQNRKVVKIEKPFWICETEITNGQYGIYDPHHDTRYLREDGKDHIVPGYIANHPSQPVARVTYQEAEKFCEWVTKKLGGNLVCRLPSEAQWEWAARAGTETPFWYGDRDTDFSKFANLSGEEVRWTYTVWEAGSVVHLRRPYPADSIFPLRDNRFTDKWFVVDYVKQYEPNPWGLYDVIGNVWEWTVPEAANTPKGKVVARGGSWKDRPKVVGAAARVIYEPWQKVMNVGLRPIIVEE
ncbi:MAG: SUMF1/EgtB/PvdO family nonheme iron enzyme [Planctomycetaceae bacterium]|nr:SUMF1/EgtB/PvdO family nonheme iron enzyme [Planctomycetaceae bacterium]